jgi:hypothetical protein
MKALLLYLVISIAAIGVTVFLAISAPPSNGRMINCGVAEISPDFTPAMREACRKARMENIK